MQKQPQDVDNRKEELWEEGCEQECELKEGRQNKNYWDAQGTG